MNLNTVKGRVQAMVEDRPDADGNVDFCDEAYLLPHLNQAYESLLNSFATLDLSFDEEDIDIPSLPIGTSDLSPYFAAGQPLEQMVLPMSVEWKTAGDPVENFLTSRKVDQIPNLEPDTTVPYWEFTGGVIKLQASTVLVDIRIRAEVIPQALTEGTDAITVAGLGFILAYRTAEHVGMARGNQNWVVQYGKKADDGLDDLKERWVKNSQGIVRRVGRTMRSNRRLTGWPRLQQ